MKRLIKLNESEFTYKFESPITVNIGDDFTWKAETYMLESGSDDEDIIRDAINESMSNLGPKGLAIYESKDVPIEIKSIIVTVQNGKAITIVKSSKELSEKELKNIKEYITGQFSDGWGEGFEQNTLNEWTEKSEDEGFDEEDQEYYTDDSEYKVTMGASFYNSKNWYIKLV